MSREPWIASAVLSAPAGELPALRRFYGERLGLRTLTARDDAFVAPVGEATIGFTGVTGATRPFHHFALLVPGDRFAPARDWLGASAELLGPDGEPGGETTFTFDFWTASACYALDPAGNILELIAHHGLAENGASGAFRAAELVGISELGLVVADHPAAASALAAAGLELWAGTLEPDDGLAFIGQKARTLILATPGRGWLPTGRPAESHLLTATLRAGGATRLIRVADGALSVSGDAGDSSDDGGERSGDEGDPGSGRS